MSVQGYPADMSIFCNLQLGLLELQEDTPQADIDQDNVSLAGMLQGAVGRAVDTPVFARACCWTIIRGFHTIAGGMEHAVGDASGRRFHNPSASRGGRFCSS